MTATIEHPHQARRTKIVATVGPASRSPAMIARLLRNGVNTFRLNFSHGSADDHRQTVATIREVMAEQNAFAAIMGDLQGPKIRIGELDPEPLQLKHDEAITLTVDQASADCRSRIHVQYRALPDCVDPGDTLLLDDGLIRLRVTAVQGDDVQCTVETGGALKSRKGLNRLGGGLSAPALTDKDRGDMALAAELALDYLAVSFPSCAEDLQPVRETLQSLDADIGIIAKIERAEAVADDATLDALIQAADGVMVARGDLGVEIGDAHLIGVQKKIIRQARRYYRPVITATQMMDSMINSPIPTRAEVFDVANAVLDGTDAVMLSAETASGHYPAETVAAMANTCLGAELEYTVHASSYRLAKPLQDIDQAIALAAIYTANNLDNVAAIVCLTESGKTALSMSRLNSALPIFALSRHRETCNKMALYRGVIPLCWDFAKHENRDPYHAALQMVGATGALQPGERVTITCGDIQNVPGLTNTVKVLAFETE